MPLVFLLFLGVVAAAGGAPPAVRPTLHVATLNIAHGRGLAADQLGHTREFFEGNIDAVAAVIKRENPDVIALQEADAPSVWSGLFDHVTRLREVTSYEHLYHGIHMDVGGWGMQARYGTAIMAHIPLGEKQSFTFIPQGLHRKGFVVANVEFEGRALVVVSLHLDSQSAEARAKQVDVIMEALAGRKLPMIVMGDFNSRWSNEKDAVRLVAQRLKLDAFEPDSREMLTYHAARLTKRIDWILISPELEFVSYGVWPDKVSDHLGVTAKVRWKEAK